jgi:signal transduction histidine kinase
MSLSALKENEANQLAEYIARDAHRLSALHEKHILDAPKDPNLDRLTRLAASALNAPIALITLVDRNRQYFAAECGLSGKLKEERQTPLSHSFCKHVVASGEPLLIDDSRTHPLTANNPANHEYGVAAYAGVPLLDSVGYPLGTICVVDQKPRRWTENDTAVLRSLAAQAVAELELKAKIEKLDDELHAAKRTEEERLQFTRLTVHDLRTPLTSLRFCLDNFSEFGPLSAEQREYIQLCSRSAEMLTRIVDNLLDIEAVSVRGQQALKRAAWNPADVAQRAFEQAQGVAAHKGVSLKLEVPERLPATLMDGEKIARVLVNLLGNAVKFTRAGGSVLLRAGVASDQTVIFYEVADTGIGIAREDAEKIFREGVCLNGAATSYESVGLGLTFCRRMVEAHRGKISVHSEIGKGSTFRVELPVNPRA